MKALAVALAVVVGVLVGFYGGFHTGRSNPTASAPAVPVTAASTGTAGASGAAGATGTGGASGPSGAVGGRGAGGGSAGGGGAGFGGRGPAGTVTNVTATGFTIHNPGTGADTKVVFDAAVTVRRTVAGQVSDLQEGMTVAVTGPTGTDGTVTATAVTITPSGPGTGG